jgi:TatD DNase family protein
MPNLTNLFDTHFHVTPEDNPAEMAKRAQEVGVSRMLVAGAKVGDAEAMLERIAPLKSVYAAVGVHPHEAEKFDGDVEPYRRLTANPCVRAIGEVGLDHFYDFAPKKEQRDTFEAFLHLAVETNLPIVIHCRDANQDTLDSLNAVLPADHPFVIHCCTAPPEWAEQFLARGGWLSFTGILTFKKSDEVRAVMRMTPPDRLMFETDAPYLAPMPYRGRRNEPALLPYIVAFAADHLDEDPQVLGDRSTANALRFFNI